MPPLMPASLLATHPSKMKTYRFQLTAETPPHFPKTSSRLKVLCPRTRTLFRLRPAIQHPPTHPKPRSTSWMILQCDPNRHGKSTISHTTGERKTYGHHGGILYRNGGITASAVARR